jgi:hypothetical protein
MTTFANHSTNRHATIDRRTMTVTTDAGATTTQLDALLARLAGKIQGSPAEFVGRLCEIKRVCPAKWQRFVDGAQAQMHLSADDVAAIVAYVTK